MENWEQMIQVANDCVSFENASGKKTSNSKRICKECTQYAEGACMKDLFESALITID